MNLKLRSAISLVFTIAILAASAFAVAGAVYTETNSPGANFIKVYLRSDTGQIWPAVVAAFPTGGAGTGKGLGSQGALAIDDANHFLFAVNAGSNSISVFEITESGLRLMNVVPSRGKNPISLTVKRNLLYVLNAGGAVNGIDTVAGFAVGENGHLTPIVSQLVLSGPSVGPAQISFNTDGDLLMVTEKATNNIDVFTVDNNGMASGPQVFPSAGQTPYGFAFGKRGQVFVSDTFGGAENAGAMSSYSMSRAGALHTISGVVADNQSAPCWVVLTADGRYAYTTNTASGSVSSYGLGFDGVLHLLKRVSASTGSGSTPVDEAVSNDSRFIYVLAPGASSIQGFSIAIDGSLTPNGRVGLVPASASGLVAR